VRLEEGVEGLIHVSQLPKGNTPKEFGINDEIQAEIVNVSQEEKRIGLSVRKLSESKERDAHKGYVKNQKQATSNLGDLLREKMVGLEDNDAL
jgi:small subunit ribosomal protein S1